MSKDEAEQHVASLIGLATAYLQSSGTQASSTSVLDNTNELFPQSASEFGSRLGFAVKAVCSAAGLLGGPQQRPGDSSSDGPSEGGDDWPVSVWKALQFLSGLPDATRGSSDSNSSSDAPYSFLIRTAVTFESATTVEKLCTCLLRLIRSSLATTVNRLDQTPAQTPAGNAEDRQEQQQEPQAISKWTELVLLSVKAFCRVIGGGNACRCPRELLLDALELLQGTAKWALVSMDFHGMPVFVTALFKLCLETIANIALNLQPKYSNLLSSLIPFLTQQFRGAHTSVTASPSSSSSSSSSSFSFALQRLLCSLRVLSVVILNVRSESSLLSPLLDDLLALVSYGLDSQTTRLRSDVSSASSDDDRSFSSTSSSSSSSPTDSESDADPWNQSFLAFRKLSFASSSSSSTTTPLSSSSSSSTSSTSVEHGPRRAGPSSHKIRLAAIHCLTAIVKTDQKLFFGYWETFFSAEPTRRLSPQGPAPDIFDIIDADSSISVRLAAVSLLTSIMDRSSHLLIAANDLVRPPPSFEPFSWRLAALLRKMHVRACRALKHQHNAAVKTALFKFTSVLVANVPYANLRAGLIEGLFDVVFDFALGKHTHKHKRPSSSSSSSLSSSSSSSVPSSSALSLRKSALTCLSSFGATPSPSPVLRGLLSSRLSLLVRALHSAKLLADCCALVAPFSVHYPDIIEASWPLDLRPLLQECLAPAAEEDTRIAAAKMLDEISKHVRVEHVWLDLLRHVQLGLLLDDPSSAVRSTVASVFANVPDLQLSERELAAYITSIFALVQDPVPAVRAAACRTLGFYVQHTAPFFRSGAFVTDVGSLLIEAARDEAVIVRLRSSWSLANLCEVLATPQSQPATPASATSTTGDDATDRREDDPGDIEESATTANANEWSELWNQGVVRTVLGLFTDIDKIRCNAVRAAGFFLGSPITDVSESTRAVVDQLLLCLSKGSVKVRWNACYAFISVFKNPRLFDYLTQANVVRLIADVVVRSGNFKVRINGLLALSDCPRELIAASAAGVCAALQPLGRSTSQTPESPIALRYQAKFSRQLEDTLNRLQALVNDSQS